MLNQLRGHYKQKAVTRRSKEQRRLRINSEDMSATDAQKEPGRVISKYLAAKAQA